MSNDLAVLLEHTVPITLEPLMRTVAAHAIPGIETCDLLAARHSRSVRGESSSSRSRGTSRDRSD